MAPSAEAAIAEWLKAHRRHAFAGNDQPYVGACPSDWRPDPFLCSSSLEELAPLWIYTVGVNGTNWGGDLLLRGTAEGWEVLAASGWPEPEQNHGPPWSPVTAITKWWSEGRAEQAYGRDVFHLRRCDEAIQARHPILCSQLRKAEPSRRVYASGLRNEDPDVYLLVEEQSSHQWLVTATAPVAPDDPTASNPPW